MLHDWSIPRPGSSASGYPSLPFAYVDEWTMRDDSSITIRPIRPRMSQRWCASTKRRASGVFTCVISTISQLSTRVTHERLTRICFIDYDREMVSVGRIRTRRNRRCGTARGGRLLRGSRICPPRFRRLARAWSRDRAASEARLLARKEGIRRVFGDILAENVAMQDILPSTWLRSAILQQKTAS